MVMLGNLTQDPVEIHINPIETVLVGSQARSIRLTAQDF